MRFGFYRFFSGKTKEQLFTVLRKARQQVITNASQYVVNRWPSLITHTD